MNLVLTCLQCHEQQRYDPAEIIITDAGGYCVCAYCLTTIPVVVENTIIGENQQSRPLQPVLEKGAVVLINNPQHAWHNAVAIVCGVKPRFYRVEAYGRRLWLPIEWVKHYEPNDFNA